MKTRTEEWIFEVIVFAILLCIGGVCGWTLKVWIG